MKYEKEEKKNLNKINKYLLSIHGFKRINRNKQ